MTANTTARMMSMSACAEENDLAGTAWSVFLEFCVMKVKRVEEVAVVATHAVMKATPQMTCPATKWATVLPSNVCHSTDETHHGSQIADDGQGIFCRCTIRVDNLPDDGTCRGE